MGVGDSVTLVVGGRGPQSRSRRQKSKFRKLEQGARRPGLARSQQACGEGLWTAKESRGMLISSSESCMGREATRKRSCCKDEDVLDGAQRTEAARTETLQYMLACVMYGQDEQELSGCDELD